MALNPRGKFCTSMFCLPTRSIYIVTLQYCSGVGRIDFIIDFGSKVLECDSTSTKQEPGREQALSPQIDIGDTLSYYLNLPVVSCGSGLSPGMRWVTS